MQTNNSYIIQNLNFFIKKKLLTEVDRGFTLIELLVVMILIGILSGISLPVFYEQTTRARQTEAEIVLGAINRAQQTYRVDSASFGTLQQLANRGNLAFDVDGSGNVNTNYYQFTSVTQNSITAQIDANAIATSAGDLRDYQSAVFQDLNSGVFNNVICRGLTSSDDSPVADADPANAATACTGNSTIVN